MYIIFTGDVKVADWRAGWSKNINRILKVGNHGKIS